MIDLHCHILPGVDDGPATLEESCALARAAQLGGTRKIAATPHVDHHYGLDADTIHAATEDLQRHFDAAGIEVALLAAGELDVHRLVELDDAQLRRFAFGKGGWLLVECPLAEAGTLMDRLVADLHRRGHQVLLAHPERSPAFIRHPESLAPLVDAGALAQVTSGSLQGRFGETVRRAATKMLRDGLVHVVASDAHDAVRRGPDLKAGLAAAGAEALAAWMTEEVPRAIVEGTTVPPRPPFELGRPTLWQRLRASSRR